MTGNDWMQDTWDNWDNHMDLAGITNRGIIGFKYFGFGGVSKNVKGVKAFPGAQKGDGTKLNLWLTPGGKGAFRIHVMLDGPYANSVHNGKEIAVIDVPADAQRTVQKFEVPVPTVEGLKGKHAIYLVAEGPEVQAPPQPQWGRPRQPQRPQGLFDLHGIAFSKGGEKCAAPAVPQVIITADGQQLAIPSTPVRSPNFNGDTDLAP